MKTVESLDEAATLECSNGHQFYVNACTEENLYHDGRRLRAICPTCGEMEFPPDASLEHKVNLASREKLDGEQLLFKMAEEASELAAGICKFLNKPNLDPYVYLEEIVDMQLLLDQFKFNTPGFYQTMEKIKEEKLKKVAKHFKVES